MRLIDADAINPMRCPRSISEMRKWIDDQPTAYDIDKVVEQLEENWQIVRGNYAVERSGYYEGKMDAYDRAIEIVKGGKL